MAHKFGKIGWGLVVLCVILSCAAFAQKDKAKDVSGHYEGTAKNGAGEVITVNLDLTEKDGAITGMIRSSHGDFAITGGSHQGDKVTIQFDANGDTGKISLEKKEDSLVGEWNAGDDGGSVEVKRAAAQEGADKGKS